MHAYLYLSGGDRGGFGGARGGGRGGFNGGRGGMKTSLESSVSPPSLIC